MVALLLAVPILFGATADFSDEIAAQGFAIGEADGVVNSYTSMTSPMGMDYDAGLGLLWQGSEDGTGGVYTVDPSNGAYTLRFNIPNYFSGADLQSNGCHYDAANNYLYFADYNGDGGITAGDLITCFYLDDPDSPTMVDYWDLTTLDGALGITYKAPYFYVNFYGVGQLREYTLSAGGSYTLNNSWSASYGGIWYYETWNVFYTHAALGTMVYVLDGDDPSNILDSFAPGCTMGCCMAPDPMPEDYLWSSDFYTTTNNQIDNEYVPAALETTTWGNIKTAF